MKKQKKNIKIKNKGLLIGIIMIVLIIGFFLMRGTITGYTVLGNEIIIEEGFKVINLAKSPNSILEVKVSTSKLSTILVEMEEACDRWRRGQDSDNIVMDKYENIKDIRFNIGDPSLNTIQQIELYKSDDICLVIGNLESGENKARISTRQGSEDKWNIIS